jgi:hypothetical protein
MIVLIVMVTFKLLFVEILFNFREIVFFPNLVSAHLFLFQDRKTPNTQHLFLHDKNGSGAYS